MFSTRAALLEKNPPREGERVIGTLKPYPAYKDSGVEWLGQVPEHWGVRRLKTVVDHINEQTSTKNDEDLYIALEHVESWTGRLLVPSREAQFDSQVKRFRAGDVLFGKLRPYLAKVVRPKQNGVCVSEFFVLRARSVVAPHYLEVVLRSAPAIDFVNSSTYGAKMPRADWTFVGAILFPLPPLPEQTAIVRFLEWAERRIRRLIWARRRRIKLLEEYKQALIHRAVTGQIDVRTGQPYPAYKDSGVEWLGKLPAHWDVCAVRHITRPVKGRQPKALYSEQEAPAGAQPYLTMEYLRGHTGTAKMYYAQSDGLVTAAAGDVLLLWDGANAGEFFTAKAGIVSSTAALLPITGHNKRYLYFMLKQCEPWLRALSTGMGIPHVDGRLLKQMQICLPPLPEQTAIVEYLDAQTTKIDAAIAAARREIDLLREYRTRLIADVVTGKVDVRKVAARLPEEPAEEEAELEDTEETAEGEAADNEAAAETFSEEEVEP